MLQSPDLSPEDIVNVRKDVDHLNDGWKKVTTAVPQRVSHVEQELHTVRGLVCSLDDMQKWIDDTHAVLATQVSVDSICLLVEPYLDIYCELLIFSNFAKMTVLGKKNKNHNENCFRDKRNTIEYLLMQFLGCLGCS